MPPNDHECVMKERFDALEKALDESNKNHSRTHEGMFDRIRKLETENAVQNERYKNIDGKLDDLTSMVKGIVEKPGKRWDSIVDKAVWAVFGAVIVYLLSQFGL